VIAETGRAREVTSGVVCDDIRAELAKPPVVYPVVNPVLPELKFGFTTSYSQHLSGARELR